MGYKLSKLMNPTIRVVLCRDYTTLVPGRDVFPSPMSSTDGSNNNRVRRCHSRHTLSLPVYRELFRVASVWLSCCSLGKLQQPLDVVVVVVSSFWVVEFSCVAPNVRSTAAAIRAWTIQWRTVVDSNTNGLAVVLACHGRRVRCGTVSRFFHYYS